MTRTTPRRSFHRLATLTALAAVLVAGLSVGPVAASGRPGDLAPEPGETLSRGRCGPLWVTATADPTVANWQAVGQCEIDRRLATIAVLGSVVDAAGALTDDHAAALDRILADSAAGLRALRAEIEADTALAELREDLRRIVEDFRIYVLVARQVHLVVAADTVEATVDRFGETVDTLEAAIDAAEAAGTDVTEARRLLAALVEDVRAADAAVDDVARTVLPLTPADWNDETAQPLLRAARQAVADARDHLRQALVGARAILAILG